MSALLRCTLHAATGTDADCPGAACALWDEKVGRCALAPVEDVVARHSELAAYLLQVRGDVEAARDTTAM